MKKEGVLALVILAVFILILSVNAFALEKLYGYVNDEAGVFSPQGKALLEQEIAHLRENSSVEMAVATVKSMNGTPIEEYSLNLAHKVLGDRQKDNGILVLLAVDDGEYRIEVGYGLEPVISAALAGRIGREIMAPEFRDGNYEQGLIDGTEALIKVINKDDSWETQALVSGYIDIKPFIPFIIIIFIFFIVTIIRIKSYAKSNTNEPKQGKSKSDPDFLAAAVIASMFGRGGGGGGFGGGFSGGSSFGGFGGGGFGGGGFSGKF
jgi:uncharacterized protein